MSYIDSGLDIFGLLICLDKMSYSISMWFDEKYMRNVLMLCREIL